MFSTLRLEVQEGVAVLTLDNPAKRNALTAELSREFPEAIAQVRSDPAVRALVLTNSGNVFCAGGDLRTLEQQLDWPAEENRRFMLALYHGFLTLANLDVPTIAAIGGHAIGAGLTLTLACDLRFAAETAKMGATYLGLGLHPGMGTTHLLPYVAGYANAADLLFTCRLVNGTEAVQMGLVSRVLPADALLPHTMAVAREIAARPAGSLRMAKQAILQHKLAGLEAAVNYEANAQVSSLASAEMRALIAKALGR